MHATFLFRKYIGILIHPSLIHQELFIQLKRLATIDITGLFSSLFFTYGTLF